MRQALFSSAFAIVGAAAISPSLAALRSIWTDPLKSVGMFVPVVSFVLILRAWRGIAWQMEANWWGFGIIAAVAGVSWVQLHAVLLLVISPRWTTPLPPPSLMLLLYGVGAVLLLGGTRLLRAAAFPVALLLLANPVPHAFSQVVDLPLQTLSAYTARSFAMHLGQPLTPDHLRLMFTPEFGMFIAPGCNGMRGSVTMALIALIAGYVYRFRWMTNAAVVTAAVLLGYLFNLARLCFLVVYYIVALHLPSLQDKAKNADYVIGGVLFLFASFLLSTVIQHLRRGTEQPPEPQPTAAAPVRFSYAPLVALALTGCITGPAFASEMKPKIALVRSAAERFPQAIGSYKLVRTWDDSFLTGGVAYQWAEYASPGGKPIAVAVSPGMTWHDPLICHSVRGEHPDWQGPMAAATATGPVSFSAAFYADGVTDALEASSQCVGGACNEFATQRTHFGLVYTKVNPASMLERPSRSLPVVVRAEAPSWGVSDAAARPQLAAQIQSFLSAVDLRQLTRP